MEKVSYRIESIRVERQIREASHQDRLLVASAILLLLLAYILGHLIQGLSYDILPSTMVDSEGRERYPSNVLLDASDTSMDQETKKRIRSISTRIFGLDLDAQDTDLRRAAVFFQATSALLKQKGDKGAVYWEQFEGLYAMARNVSLALGMGAFYFLGWGTALTCHFARFYTPISFVASVLVWALLVLVIVSTVRNARSPRRDIAGSKSPSGPSAPPLSAAKKFMSGVISHWVLALSLASISFLAGSQIALSRTDNRKVVESKPSFPMCCFASAPESQDGSASSVKIERPGFIMLLLGLAIFAATLRIHRAFKGFAREFALAVWRDFGNFDVTG